MKKIALHLSRATRIALVFCLILLAIMVSAARVILPMIDGLRDQINDGLSNTLETRVDLGVLTGRLHNFNPAISLDRLVIYQSDKRNLPSITLRNIILELDTIASLSNMQPVFRRAVVGGGEVLLTGRPGSISLTGFSQKKTDDTSAVSQESEKAGIRGVMEVLGRQRQIDFEDIHLTITMPSGQESQLVVQRLTLNGPADSRKMSARVSSPAGEVIKLGVNISGQALDWPNVELNGYISTPAIDVRPWLTLLPAKVKDDLKLSINQLHVGTETWFTYKPISWDLRGSLKADVVDIDWDKRTVPPLTSLDTGYNLRFGRQQSLQLWLNGLSFAFSGHSYPESNLYFKRETRQGNRITLTADRVHLQPLSLISISSDLLPELAGKIVSRLAPRGYLEDLVLRFNPRTDPSDFDLSARLKEVGVDHWYGAPSGERVSGRFRMNASQGVIDLDSRGFTLGLDNVFDDVWVYDRVAGQLFWNIIDDTYILRTDGLSLAAGEGDIEARMRLDIPFDSGRPIWMALEAGITEGDASYTGKYLPVKGAMSEDLAGWLNSAIKGGDIRQGAFIWNGPLTAPHAKNDLTWGLFFDLASADLAYSPDWPEVKGIAGLATIDQDEVLVKADKARVYNSQVKDMTASVPGLTSGKPLFLKLKGEVASSSNDGLRILRETPIAKAMGHAADDWEMGGDLKVGLDLDIPLDLAKGKETVNVDISMVDNRFALPKLALDASSLAGELSYTTRKGLQGKNLKGVLFGKPVSFNISTASGTTQETLIDLGGRIALKSLAGWAQRDFLWLANGEADYRAQVRVGSSADDKSAVRVDVNTDLVGVASSMPAPLNKARESRLPATVTVKSGSSGQLTVEGHLSDSIHYVTELSRNGEQLQRGGIRFGSGGVDIPQKGVLVTGHLASLKLQPWMQWWTNNASKIKPEQIPGSDSTVDSSSDVLGTAVEVKELAIDKLYWEDHSFDDLVVGYRDTAEGMNLDLKAPQGEGALVVPKGDLPLQVSLDRLNLPDSIFPSHEMAIEEAAQASAEKEQKADLLAAINPADIPDADVQAKDIRIGDQSFGHINLKLRAVNSGIKATEISGELGGGTLSGDLTWMQDGGEHHTSLNAQIDSKNVEKFLARWSYPELMTGRRLKSSSHWNWEGSPAGFKINNLEGNSNIEIRNGRFLTVDSKSSASALRLFGVLNIDAIMRRLRLDFSDLFRSGMAFDQVEGKLAFDKGQINLSEPITVKGPSSDFKLDGSLNIVENNLDMGLIVTLPVTQNITVVSLLLGQPYIAGAAYLFDKLLGSTIEQFASLRYEIKGSLSEPEVKLDRLFSNKASKEKKRP